LGLWVVFARAQREANRAAAAHNSGLDGAFLAAVVSYFVRVQCT